MFDLTTIQLINNHSVAFDQVPGYRTRDLIRRRNIDEATEALLLGAQYLIDDPINLLDEEPCFTPKPFTHGEWEERQHDQAT